MKEKIIKLLKIVKPIMSVDNLLFQMLSDQTYDKFISPLYRSIEDLIFMSLFNNNYDTIYSRYTTPGNPKAKDDKGNTKVQVWDDGYPPEQILELFKNKTLSLEDLSNSIVKKVNIIIKAEKKRKT